MPEVKEINGKIVEVSPESKVFYITREKLPGILGGYEELKVIPISEPTIVKPEIKPVVKTEELEYRPAYALTEEERKALLEKAKIIFEKLKELGKMSVEELERLFKSDKEKYMKMMKELGIEVL
jgi:hypothetical protein